ncbi:hypothetical protein D9619_011372 [Psilocybe cf. subviscida]|uniref:NACHT domain-containing protein n=1 Tax=Psilocybe cf. subviscida TaxID=2480587 RepID=A0A8H5F5W1_9AGAR|nr:hypothetical protein D9619_011372 [Psilocybe cf. subviscida]
MTTAVDLTAVDLAEVNLKEEVRGAAYSPTARSDLARVETASVQGKIVDYSNKKLTIFVGAAIWLVVVSANILSKRPACQPNQQLLLEQEEVSSILNNVQNSNVHDNTFVTNIKADNQPSLDALYKRVAPYAILNAGGRADDVRCHPGTREIVIGRIEQWRRQASDGVTANRMFWLKGPAGAGKTAIVQTVAESWKWSGIHAANFFFFRTDSSRNHAKSLVSTLLYQILDFYPSAREAVKTILASKPRILDASVEEQFLQLICIPLRSIGPSLSQSIVLLVDGLDECDSEGKNSQRQVLHALNTLVSWNELPLLVLVASRAEPQITMAFNQLVASGSKFDSLFLDEQFSPDNDIHLFVTAELNSIKRTHSLAYLLDKDWPSDIDVEGIVTKSSGHFITNIR